MASYSPSITLGYHGCDKGTADQILEGKSSFLKSENSYDWLGHGSYFWEADPIRAFEWAKDNREDPYVVGVVLDLGNCLNLLEREGVAVVNSRTNI